jgi:hypothetical protein
VKSSVYRSTVMTNEARASLGPRLESRVESIVRTP